MTLYNRIKSRIYNRVFRQVRKDRKARFAHVPAFELSNVHLANAKLLADRAELLRQLPAGGVVAELGVANGSFSEQILSINAPGKLYLVDVWSNRSERYGDAQYAAVLERLCGPLENGTVEIRRGLSTDVVDSFPDEYFDWIYIDTDHSYETTLQELRRYAAKIKKGGIIAGDDFIALSKGSWGRFGVVEAVHQFCVEQGWEFIYLTMELRANPNFAIRKIQP